MSCNIGLARFSIFALVPTKAFVRAATAEKILTKIEKCRKRLEEINPDYTTRKRKNVA